MNYSVHVGQGSQKRRIFGKTGMGWNEEWINAISAAMKTLYWYVVAKGCEPKTLFHEILCDLAIT